jgi:hypothetical protein
MAHDGVFFESQNKILQKKLRDAILWAFFQTNFNATTF